MKHTSFALALICILITMRIVSACQTTSSSPEPTMTSTLQPTKEITATNTPTINPSPTVTLTHTPEEIGFYQTPTWRIWQSPTAVPPDFQTLTPSPYPTFIVENVVTATPAQAALCPVEDPNLILNPDDYVVHYENITYITDDSLVEMLSLGASFSQIKELYDNAGLSNEITVKDMTNDGVGELIYLQANRLGIVSCEAEKYETIFYKAGGCFTNIESLEDMNLNGIPDFVFSFHNQCRSGMSIDVFEWNGRSMEKVLELNHGEMGNQNSRLIRALLFNFGFLDLDNQPEMLGSSNIEILDLDQSGTKEIRIEGAGNRLYLDNWSEEPLRDLEAVFEWNGEKYLFSNITFSPPDFRYQAVQDADRYFLFHQYDDALGMYKRVISDTSLEYWTRDWQKYNFDVDTAKWAGTTPPEKPAEDPDEHEILSAYAQYRIMLIQMLKHDPTAEITYKQLQDEHPQGNAGYAFVQLARIYRESYDEEYDFVLACKPVIEAAEGMDVELDILGDAWHGGQSHCYNGADICPLDETDVALLSGDGE